MDYTVTNPGIEQLDIIEEEGGDPTKVIIGHAFVEPQGLHQVIEILDRGAFVQVDHIGIPWRHPDASQLDESMANMMCALADKGYIDQMVITYDRWFFNPRGAATEENPQLLNEKVNLGYLFTNFAPRLRSKGFRDEDFEKMLVDNQSRILPMESLTKSARSTTEAAACPVASPRKRGPGGLDKICASACAGERSCLQRLAIALAAGVRGVTARS
jgi:phosphotriesterase-related protein